MQVESFLLRIGSEGEKWLDDVAMNPTSQRLGLRRGTEVDFSVAGENLGLSCGGSAVQ